MDWKTDSNIDDSDVEPYTSFQSNKSGKLFDRMELPIILIGAGLLAIVILFVMFIPKKNDVTIDDYKHLVSRLDKLEARINQLSGTDIDVREFDPAKNPVQYQQLINWIKSNAEVISETIKKVDDIEKSLKIKDKNISSLSPEIKKSVPPKPAPTPSVVVKKQPEPKPEIKSAPEPVIEEKPIEKSKPVEVKPEKKIASELPQTIKEDVTPVVVAPPTPVPPESVAAPSASKPESGSVKLIFHRVEKGETLYRISKNYGLTVEELQKLNDMKKDDLLIHVGQELIVKKEKQ